MRTPAWLMATSFSAIPNADRRARLAPNVLVDLAHEIGLGEIQLVEAAIDEDAAGVQHGAHGAIGHDDPLSQLIAEFLGTSTKGCSHKGTAGSAEAIIFDFTAGGRVAQNESPMAMRSMDRGSWRSWGAPKVDR
jgi:hypothetical protein